MGSPSRGAGTLPGTGDGRYLVVRPEDVTVAARGAGGGGVLTGRVLDTQFSGGTTIVAVASDRVATVSGQPLLVTQPGVSTAASAVTRSTLTWRAESAGSSRERPMTTAALDPLADADRAPTGTTCTPWRR